MSVTLVLADEVDISRGDVLAAEPLAAGPLAAGRLHAGRRFAADVVWMDERPLDPSRPYVLKQGARDGHGRSRQRARAESRSDR